MLEKTNIAFDNKKDDTDYNLVRVIHHVIPITFTFTDKSFFTPESGVPIETNTFDSELNISVYEYTGGEKTLKEISFKREDWIKLNFYEVKKIRQDVILHYQELGCWCHPVEYYGA